jgi:hypothetical protein
LIRGIEHLVLKREDHIQSAGYSTIQTVILNVSTTCLLSTINDIVIMLSLLSISGDFRIRPH